MDKNILGLEIWATQNVKFRKVFRLLKLIVVSSNDNSAIDGLISFLDINFFRYFQSYQRAFDFLIYWSAPLYIYPMVGI